MARANIPMEIPSELAHLTDGKWHHVPTQPEFRRETDCGQPRAYGIGCGTCDACMESKFWARGPMMQRLVVSDDGSWIFEQRQP